MCVYTIMKEGWCVLFERVCLVWEKGQKAVVFIMRGV